MQKKSGRQKKKQKNKGNELKIVMNMIDINPTSVF